MPWRKTVINYRNSQVPLFHAFTSFSWLSRKKNSLFIDVKNGTVVYTHTSRRLTLCNTRRTHRQTIVNISTTQCIPSSKLCWETKCFVRISFRFHFLNTMCVLLIIQFVFAIQRCQSEIIFCWDFVIDNFERNFCVQMKL